MTYDITIISNRSHFQTQLKKCLRMMYNITLFHNRSHFQTQLKKCLRIMYNIMFSNSIPGGMKSTGTVHQLALLNLSLVVLLKSLVVYSVDKLMVTFSIMLMLRQSFVWSLRWARFTSIDLLLLIQLSLSQIWSSNTKLLLRSSLF